MRSTYSNDISNSLSNYLIHELLEQGAYINVATGDTTAGGIKLGKLYPVVDKKISSTPGIVWQSFAHNWIYESGVLNLPVPSVASGVFVDGTYYAKSSSKNHYIDYENGRVIFNSAVSTASTVLANFSYSEYSFVRPSLEDVQGETKFTSNSQIYPTGVPASPEEIFLPVIIMEQENNTDQPFQFGGPNTASPTYKFTILAEKQFQVEQAADLFVALRGKSFSIVSTAEGPRFNAMGDLNENYSFYNWRLKSTNLGTFEDITYQRIPDDRAAGTKPEVFAGMVRMNIFAMRV